MCNRSAASWVLDLVPGDRRSDPCPLLVNGEYNLNKS
jgi:hypothetical protein